MTKKTSKGLTRKKRGTTHASAPKFTSADLNYLLAAKSAGGRKRLLENTIPQNLVDYIRTKTKDDKIFVPVLVSPERPLKFLQDAGLDETEIGELLSNQILVGEVWLEKRVAKVLKEIRNPTPHAILKSNIRCMYHAFMKWISFRK